MDTENNYIADLDKNALWEAWKEVRRQLPKSSRRDVTDYVEFDVDPDEWIDRLLEQVNGGQYEPRQPYRFSLAKKLGFRRTITFPHVPDLVLYRALTELIYRRAKPTEKGNVYFARNTRSKLRRSAEASDSSEPSYEFMSGSAFAKWKEYDEYRKRLLVDKVFPYFVLTDIANYFDSILYARTLDAIQGIEIGRNLVGLLFFLLERLSPRDPYNESPRIGLPVDEFDCSRTLAHIVLFPHDRRMIQAAGEEAYVRWMDDQLLGVPSYAAGLRSLAGCGRSLARLHLTPNTSKTQILSLRGLAYHFHLELNSELNEIDDMLRRDPEALDEAGDRLEELWCSCGEQEAYKGEWTKILKRVYRLAGISGRDFLLDRAVEDLLREPTLALRIADYVRVLSGPSEYLEFVLSICADERQVHPDVSRFVAEGLLKVEASGSAALRLRAFSSKLLQGAYSFVGWKECAAISPLLILRFGDRRALPRLRSRVRDLARAADPAIGKAVAVVYASYGESELQEVVEAASQLRDNYLADFLRMLQGMREYEGVPTRFKIRRRPVWDSVAGRWRIDMRKLLVLRLLRLNERPAVAAWVRQTRSWIVDKELSSFDQALVNRVLS